MTTHRRSDVTHSAGLFFDKEGEQRTAKPAAVLPQRTASSSGCPAPSHPVALAHNPALLLAVLDGLRRLDDGGVAR